MASSQKRPFVWPDIQEAFASAYAAAARAGADMRAATAAFEAIRDVHAAGEDIFTMRATFLEQIGRADLETVVPVLSTLRAQFEQIAIAGVVADLKAVYSRDSNEGRREWLTRYAQCFDERAWWRTLAAAMAREALPEAVSADWSPSRVLQITHSALRGVWPGTTDWFLFLASQDLTPEQRATMLMIPAEIYLYIVGRPETAHRVLDQATSIAPEHLPVLRVWGGYWLTMEDVDQARAKFEKVLSIRPQLADGFVGLGDCADKRKEGSLAERYYTQAIANAPGMYDAYAALMRWYGKPENFGSGESALGSLFQRALALAEYRPLVYAELGWIYHGSQRFDDARRAFEGAANLDREYHPAYAGLGYCDLDQARSLEAGDERAKYLTSARQRFERTVEFCPTSLDGYWALSAVAELEENLEEALSWIDRASVCPREWEPTLRVRQAELKTKLGRLSEAEPDLLAALSLEPGAAGALATLLDLATAYENRSDRDAARRILQQWREAKGPDGEATYHNRIGNLHYSAGDYAAAADEYRAAITASPRDHVLRSNLALALDNLRDSGHRREALEEAAAALGVALELSPQNASYTERLTKIDVELRFIAAYGEAALAHEPLVLPIRVDIDEGLFPDLLNAAHDALSPETLALIEAMRTNVRDHLGVVVPGVRFFPLNEPSSSNYRIFVMDALEATGYAPPGARFTPRAGSDRLLATTAPPTGGVWLTDPDVIPPPGVEAWTAAAYIVRHVQNVVEARLYRFIGYEDAMKIVRDAAAPAEAVANDPLEVTRFLQVLRTLARSHMPLTAGGTLAQRFADMRAAGTPVDAIASSLLRQPPAVHTVTSANAQA